MWKRRLKKWLGRLRDLAMNCIGLCREERRCLLALMATLTDEAAKVRCLELLKSVDRCEGYLRMITGPADRATGHRGLDRVLPTNPPQMRFAI